MATMPLPAIPRFLHGPGWLAALLTLGLAAAADATTDHYGVADGLSHNSVIAIEIDDNGYLWLGTESGLNRFDGVEFKHFHSTDDGGGLPDSFIQRLARSGRHLWIGTIGGGLARMDLHSERIEAIDLRTAPDSREANTVHGLAPLDDENVLVATVAGLIAVRWPVGQEPKWSRVRSGGFDPGPVTAVLRLKDQRVAVGGELGACILEPALGTCTTLPEEAQRNIYGLGESTEGELFVAYARGGFAVHHRDGRLRRRFDLTSTEREPGLQRVLSFAPQADGSMWLGTDDGLYQYHPNCECVAGPFDRSSGPRDRKLIYALALGQEGQLWMGSWNQGLERFDPQGQAITAGRVRDPNLPAPLTAPTRAFADFDQHLCFGTYGAGVYCRAKDAAPTTPEFQAPALKPANAAQSQVWALLTDTQGRLLVGSDGGLYGVAGGISGPALQIDQQTKATQVRSLLVDQQRQVWVGTQLGLYALECEPADGTRCTLRAVPQQLPDRRIFALAETRSGTLLLGTWSGVYEMDPHQARPLERFAPDAGLRVVWDLLVLEHEVWVGSNDGLYQIPADGPMRRYTEADGLASRVAYGVEVDRSGALWISTNRGLTRLDSERRQSLALGLRDGLGGLEYLFGGHARLADGRLAFGGTHGYSLVDPARFVARRPLPIAQISRITIDHSPFAQFDKRVALDPANGRYRQLTIGAEDRQVEFWFACPGAAGAADFVYQYRIVELDPNWHRAQRRYASYADLPPGLYTLEYRALSRLGEPGPSSQLMLKVQPEWWQRLETRLLAACLLAGLVALVVRWRTAGLVAARTRLEHEVALRTGELREQRDLLARVNRELEVLSRHDVLTGLPNRRAILARLDDLVERQRRTGDAFWVALIDLDHFKRINDGHGHAAGDAALVHVAEIARAQLEPQARIGRYGGEEFLAVGIGEIDDGRRLLEAFIGRLRELPLEFQGLAIPLRASVGMAAAELAERIESTMARADQALYAAKQAGRDRLVVA